MTTLSVQEPLLKNPAWQEKDLGIPLPASPFAVSVAMPLWQHVVDYEKGEAYLHNALQCGYPRFVYHPLVKQFFKKCTLQFGLENEYCLALPSKKSANLCLDFVYTRTNIQGKLFEYGKHDVWIVSFPKTIETEVKSFWMHTGFNITARYAKALMENTVKKSTDTKQKLREKIAQLYQVSPKSVFLCPGGMASFFTVHQVLTQLLKNAKTVQFGFPYVDSLKIQEKFGSGVHFFPRADKQEQEAFQSLLEKEKIAGVFCEFPTNPLLQSHNLQWLFGLTQKHKTPLIIDDTIGTVINTNVIEHSDAVITSLTKNFSGVGEVMGGAIILNEKSQQYNTLLSCLQNNYEDLVYEEDAEVLLLDSEGFEERMRIENSNAEKLCDFLRAHPQVEKIYYPKYQADDNYHAVQKKGGGYGCLFSITLKNDKNAPVFFDNLRISKGPSLGTNFSLACPYTLLAHYNELPFVQQCGIPVNLIRVSVGLEPIDDLIERFDTALKITAKNA